MSNYEEGSAIAGRFVVHEKIGQGGMGAVFRALQTSLDRDVALKVLHSDKAFTAHARRRFGREARAIARLNHPHIAGVYDFGTDNDDQTLWLAMEMVDGYSMSKLRRKDVDVLQLASLTDQILSALSAAHARGIIHRDLKPSNILVGRDDAGREIIKLVDFGLAATQSGDLDLKNAPGGLDASDDEPSKKRVILGTPRYMAPEIFRRKPVDPRVDLYALGVILFEILAGQPPYPGDDPKTVMNAHLKTPIPQLKVRGGQDLPAEFERCIYALLTKDPDERIQSAAEARERIQTVINQFSYVPWMLRGPQLPGNNAMSHPGNMTGGGFLSGYGGRTIPPAAIFGGTSDFAMPSSQKAPLVGRRDERRSIERRVRRAVEEGSGGLIFVEAPPGAGKSRLVEWIRVRVEESGVMRVTEGNYSRSTGGFNGVRAILEDILGTRDASYDQLPYLIRTRLEQWGFANTEIDQAISLMQPGGEDAVFETPDFDATRATNRREQIFSTLENIMRRAARERPLLIILEDLHFAGEPTSAFLEHLSVGLQFDPTPLMVLGTLRSGEARSTAHLSSTLERLKRVKVEDVLHLELGRMETSEIVALIEHLVPVEDSVSREIAQHVSGNPLHATELLRYLHESEKLRYDNGKWALAPGVDIESEIPTEIADMMRYRARQVWENHDDPAAMKAILERAVILGRHFDFRLFQSMLSREPAQPFSDLLDATLEVLVRDSILREVGHSGEDILEFDHVLMREVLLQDMDGRRSLRDLHRLAAEAKIDYFTERIDAHAEEIVEHYRHARDPQGVYIYTLKAARAAANSSDLQRAMQLYREAEELSVAANGHPFDGMLAEASYVLQSEEVALEVAHLERRVGEYDAARQHYRKLLSGDHLPVTLWARWGLGKLAERRGDFNEAIGWYEATRREAQAATNRGHIDRDSTTVDAMCLLASARIALVRAKLPAADTFLGDALQLAEGIDDIGLQADILECQARLESSRAQFEKADALCQRAAALATRLDDPERNARIQLTTAELLAEIGEPERSLKLLADSLAAFQQLGKEHLEAECLLLMGVLHWRRGDYKPAARNLRTAHKSFGRFEDRRGLTRCKYHLSCLALSIGRHKETLSLGRDALAGFRKLEARRHIAATQLLLARLQRDLEKLDSALKLVERATADYRAIDDTRGQFACHAVQALILEQMGESKRVDQIVKQKIIREVAENPALQRVSCEDAACALDELSRLLNLRDPGMAIDVDGLAENIYRRLGRSNTAQK